MGLKVGRHKILACLLCAAVFGPGCTETSAQLSIESLSPEPGATGIGLDARVEVHFDRPVALSADGQALSLRSSGELVSGELALEAGGGPLVFTPTRMLIAGQSYEASLAAESVTSLDGELLGETRTWSFSTVEGCQPEPTAAAQLAAGPAGDGSIVIPGGRRITPQGRQVLLGSFPTRLAVWPNRPWAISSDDGWGRDNKVQSLSLVHTDTAEVIQTIGRGVPDGFYYGLALSSDGSFLYASGGSGQTVEVFSPAEDDSGLLQVATWPVKGFPAGLLLDENRGLLYVLATLDGELVALDTSNGEERFRRPVGKMPYDLVFSADRSKLYISMWARIQLFDPGHVVVADAETGQVEKRIEVGKNPEQLVLLDDGRLLVACSDADRVDVIDTTTDELAASWPVRPDLDPELAGASPVALEVDPARGRLYVAAAQTNSVEVLSLVDGSHKGSIPSAWYPTDLRLSPDGQRLFVLNGKGEGSGPNLTGVYIYRTMRGSLSIFEVPDDEALESGLTQVRANNAYPTTFFPERCTGKAFPIPRVLGQASPIKHVVFILRENKTYDQNLGDLEDADGDASLTMFGESITPNLHALAREFCNLDNFHAEIEVSVQGHYWNVASTINDFAEKIWHAGYRDDSRVPSTGTLQPDYPIGGFIWHKLQDAGIDFRDYGEPMGLAGEYQRFMDHVNMDYMLDLARYLYDQPDAEKAQVFLDEMEAGIFPPFVYLALLNDHTWGGSAGKPTPQWMVAENDYATGLVVDKISHSPYWPETLIIVTEDDPQSGADHVDNHRSIALLISPYTRKGYTSSVHHGFSSLIRTYGLILGMPPLNMMDAQAAPIYECFTSTPNFAPYDLRPMQVEYELNPSRSPAALASAHMDFSVPDQARGLGAVLWWATHPNEPMPPELAHEKAALDASLRRNSDPRSIESVMKAAAEREERAVEEEEERRPLPMPYGWRPWNEMKGKDKDSP